MMEPNVDNVCLLDEAAMCVFNRRSVRKRMEAMDGEEWKYAQDISDQFLINFVRMAHCRDPGLVKEAAYSMLSLMLNNIFSGDPLTNKLKSFKAAPAHLPGVGESGHQKSLEETVINTVLGSLDPAVILSSILRRSGGGDHMSMAVEEIVSVLHGFNPIKLDDFVILYACKRGLGCEVCNELKSLLRGMDFRDSSIKMYQRALVLFLRCINHDRLDFGGCEDLASATPAFVADTSTDSSAWRLIVFPLRKILLGCLDGADETRKLSSFDSSIAYGDTDEAWVSALHRAVQLLTFEDRALYSHIYAYLLLSRHRRRSGDFLNQFMYTIFARFIYSATETLFCAAENASSEIDGGKFIKYVAAMTKTCLMSSTFNTLKSFQLWREQTTSVAPLLDILSSGWRKHYNPADLPGVNTDMVTFVKKMAESSSMIKEQRGGSATSGLDSVRCVRQIEGYIPYGMMEMCPTGMRLSKAYLGMAATTRSNGSNFHCNSFHILSNIRGCEELGTSANRGVQSAFEKIINPSAGDRGTGRILGHVTCIIDKKGLTNKPPDASNFEKRVDDFTREILFSQNLSCHSLVNNGALLPHKDKFPVLAGKTAECFDVRTHALLLMWQRPAIDDPNLSSLTTGQLELLISKDPYAWGKFITRCFFNIESISLQLADTIMKNMGETGRGDPLAPASDASVVDIIMSTNLKNAENAERLVSKSLKQIQREWSAVQRQPNQPFGAVTGFKALFNKNLFDVLYRIIIEREMAPSALIAEYDNIKHCVNNMDTFLMKLIA